MVFAEHPKNAVYMKLTRHIRGCLQTASRFIQSLSDDLPIIFYEMP